MQIEIADLQNHHKIKRKEIRNLLKKILKDAELEGELSLVFVNDEKIKELNNSYLKTNTITDVLAFSLDDSEDFDSKEDNNKKINGEIIVSVQTAINTAKSLNTSVESELYLYLVHGLLHLMGYDDKETKLADIMHKKEKEILFELGYNITFNDDTVE